MLYDNIYYEKRMSWKIEFYKKQNNQIPVKDFLLKTQPKIRAKIFKEIEKSFNYKNDYEKRCNNEYKETIKYDTRRVS